MSDLTHAQIGRAFVKQYYTTLYENPSGLWKLYNAYSTFVHGGNDCTGEGDVFYGVEQIAAKLKQLDFHECHTRIIQVDSARTLDNGVVLQVCGEISNRGSPMRRFTQTFVLCPLEARKFYVANDIFRYQDEVFGQSTPSTRRAMIDTAQYARQRASAGNQPETLQQRLHSLPSQPQPAWTSNNSTTNSSAFADCRLQQETMYAAAAESGNMTDAAAALSSPDLKSSNWTFNSVQSAAPPYDHQNSSFNNSMNSSSTPYAHTRGGETNSSSSSLKAEYAPTPRQFNTYSGGLVDEHFPLETLEVSSSSSGKSTTSAAAAMATGSGGGAVNNHHHHRGSSSSSSSQMMMNFNNSAYCGQDERHDHLNSSSNSSPFATPGMKRYESTTSDELDKRHSPSDHSPAALGVGNSLPPPSAAGADYSHESSAPSRSWAAIASCGRTNNSTNSTRTSPGTSTGGRPKPSISTAATMPATTINAVSGGGVSPSAAAVAANASYNAQSAVTMTPIRSSRGPVATSQAPINRQANTGQRYPEDHQVFVGNVSNTVDEKTLKQLMATYGKVLEVRLAERNIADKPKFAFVVFDSAVTADKLIADAAQNPLRLHGKRLNIERRNPTNRSSGAGGGLPAGPVAVSFPSSSSSIGTANARSSAAGAMVAAAGGRSSTKTSPSSSASAGGGNPSTNRPSRAQRATLH